MSLETVNEGVLFQRLRWRLLHNATREMLARSSVRPLTVLWACVVVWTFVFAISLSQFAWGFLLIVGIGGGVHWLLLTLFPYTSDFGTDSVSDDPAWLTPDGRHAVDRRPDGLLVDELDR